MPLIKIDDQEFEVNGGTTVLEAAIANGINIPYYCYHPALSIVGSCRMCLVQVEGMPKLQVSCNTQIGEAPPDRKADGKYDMVVQTQTDIVKQEQKNILEFLLLNHPLDCPVCDQAGECDLQDYAYKYGSGHSRFREDKRVRANENLGSNIAINHNRCIMCSRCIRFTREISGTSELFAQERSYYTKISVMEDNPLDNLLAGNVTDICPVGALLSTDYIHKNRIWNMSVQKSICTDCSVGCNIDVFYQYDQIFRLTPRENHDVNGYWMCDIGRYGFHRYEEVERVTTPLIREGDSFKEVSWEGALKEIGDRFGKLKKQKKNEVAGIASPFHTDETNYLLSRLMTEVLKGRGYLGMLPPIQAEDDVTYPSGFRISKDRSPNRQGALDLCSDLHEDILGVIAQKRIKLLYVLDDGVDRTLDETQKKVLSNMEFMVVQTYAMTDLARVAHVILPGPAPFEREGTMTNDQGRVQRIRSALPMRDSTREDWEIVAEVMNTLGKREITYSGAGDVTREISEKFSAYEDMSLFRIGDLGLPKNGAMDKE